MHFHLKQLKILEITQETLREKCPNTEFFLVRVFRIWTEYGEIWSISPYSVQKLENTNQKKLRI